MLSQISPSKEFLIVWNGSDPNDTSTLYVQAVVQNAKTLAVLSTVNLVDRGSHLFSVGYITPPDPNQIGNGLQIIITITVFTDAGYTIPSQNYARESRDYLVKTLISASQFWGSGGDSFDPKEMKKLVKEALSEVEVEEPKEFPVAQLVALIKAEIDKLPHELPEDKETDLTSVISSIEDVRRAINILPTFAKPTDLTGVGKEIQKIKDSLESIVNSVAHTVAQEIQKADDRTDQRIISLLESIQKAIAPMSDELLAMKMAETVKNGGIRIMAGKTAEEKKKEDYLNGLKNKYKPNE